MVTNLWFIRSLVLWDCRFVSMLIIQSLASFRCAPPRKWIISDYGLCEWGKCQLLYFALQLIVYDQRSIGNEVVFFLSSFQQNLGGAVWKISKSSHLDTHRDQGDRIELWTCCGFLQFTKSTMGGNGQSLNVWELLLLFPIFNTKNTY